MNSRTSGRDDPATKQQANYFAYGRGRCARRRDDPLRSTGSMRLPRAKHSGRGALWQAHRTGSLPGATGSTDEASFCGPTYLCCWEDLAVVAAVTDTFTRTVVAGDRPTTRAPTRLVLDTATDAPTATASSRSMPFGLSVNDGSSRDHAPALRGSAVATGSGAMTDSPLSSRASALSFRSSR